jgi:hypothetical protein
MLKIEPGLFTTPTRKFRGCNVSGIERLKRQRVQASNRRLAFDWGQCVARNV